MKQEAYKFAFDEANAELAQIMTEFEMLRVRKDKIEKVVEALKPLAMKDAPAGQNMQVERRTAETPSYSF